MGERLLFKKEKRSVIDGKTRIVSKAQTYFVEDITKDFDTEHGKIKKDDFKKSKAITNTGKEFYVLKPEFIDYYKRIKRLAQIVSLKDIGPIITICGINKNSVIAEAGSGSGALTSYLAAIAKKVYSFDIDSKNLEVSKKTVKKLKLNNVVFRQCDVYEKIPVENVDVVCLDVPEPWLAIDSAVQAVKKGGFIVSYSPCITQVQQFVETVNKHEKLLALKTIENIQRHWKVDGQAVRPKSQLDHTAFLTFVRRLG